MVGWHHWINGHECEQALGAGDGQRGLACCSPWGHKELDTTEQLKNSSKILPLNHFPPAARNSHSMLKMPNLFLPQDLCITILSAWNLSSQKIFTWLVHWFYSFLYTSLPRRGLPWHPTCSYLQAHHSLSSCPALSFLTPLITGEIILYMCFFHDCRTRMEILWACEISLSYSLWNPSFQNSFECSNE